MPLDPGEKVGDSLMRSLPESREKSWGGPKGVRTWLRRTVSTTRSFVELLLATGGLEYSRMVQGDPNSGRTSHLRARLVSSYLRMARIDPKAAMATRRRSLEYC